jgi:sporulation protein YlmC with PRC-barrel domain
MGRMTLVTTLDQEMLANSPSLEPDNWPDTSVSDWEVEIRDYWAGTGVDIVQPVAVRGAVTTPIDEPSRRASELFGAEVNLPQQNSSATIEDLLVGLTSQYINYAVLALDRGMVPVFFPLLGFDEQGQASLDVEPQVLEGAPALEAETWQDQIIAPGWDLTYRNYWIGFGLGGTPVAIQASDLLDRDVINLQNEGLGEIEDLIVQPENGQVPYAILGSGGFLGLGEELRPVPLSEFRLDPFQRVLIFNVDEETFENAPSFGADGWPDISSPDWVNDFQSYWDQQVTSTTTMTAPEQADTGDQPASGAAVRATELLEYNAQNLQNEDLGDLEDLLINLEQEQVQYAVLSVGDFLELGGKRVAVPLDRITIDPAQQLVSADVDQQALEEAPDITDVDLLDFNNPDWDAEFEDYWASR